MAKRNTFDNPIGKLVSNTMRLNDFLLCYEERKSQATNTPRVDVITKAVSNGEFYDENIASVISRFFSENADAAKAYYGNGREHDPVTEAVIPADDAAIRHFAEVAILEKIAREQA